MATMSPEEKQRLKDETRKLMQELQANLTKSTLDLTVKTDMDC